MDICRRRAEVVDKSRESSGKVGVGRKDDRAICWIVDGDCFLSDRDR